MDLIARDRKSYACFALKIKHGKHLVELKRRLNKIVGYKGVELITIWRICSISIYRHGAGIWKGVVFYAEIFKKKRKWCLLYCRRV